MEGTGGSGAVIGVLGSGVALGAELDAVHAAGAALGDSGAVTLARHLGRDDRGTAS